MSTGFPRYTQSARKGEAGVAAVSKIVTDHLGWIFRRNHQEHDFGIDGYLEVVDETGSVTGQMIAAQIKYGKSFFQEKNHWGYVYRGELKHFNYLVNHPTPVILIICHPKDKQCYWVRFVPEQAQVLRHGWKITVPFENGLIKSKSQLRGLVGPIKDSLAQLRSYWELNELLIDSLAVLYVFDAGDVQANDTNHVRVFFDRLLKTRELAAAMQGKIEFSFSGYDEDRRELFEIEEVRRYVGHLDRALPELLFFIRTDEGAHTLKLFVFCLCEAAWEGARSTPGHPARVTFDTTRLADFLKFHWPGLNNVAEWLNLSVAENKRISYAVMECLGFHPPAFD